MACMTIILVGSIKHKPDMMHCFELN